MIASVNWPQAVAAFALASVGGVLVWIIKGLWNYRRSLRTCPWASSGVWYSAEFDSKGDQPHKNRTTFLEVKLTRTLSRGVTIKVLKSLNVPEKSYATGWIIRGHFKGDCFLGEWETTIHKTKRFGVAMLKFLDNRRAVGYWVGLSGFDHPVYGYWILSQDLTELKAICERVLIEHRFTMVDVGHIVANYDRGTRPTGVRI